MLYYISARIIMSGTTSSSRAARAPPPSVEPKSGATRALAAAAEAGLPGDAPRLGQRRVWRQRGLVQLDVLRQRVARRSLEHEKRAIDPAVQPRLAVARKPLDEELDALEQLLDLGRGRD